MIQSSTFSGSFLRGPISGSGFGGGYIIRGTWDDDVLNGRDVSETIYALEGWDTVNAGDGADQVYAGWGNDWVDGGYGDDVIWGDATDQ